MFRRVKKNVSSPQQGMSGVFIGKVGGPVPAPRPTNGNINMSSMNMTGGGDSNAYMYINNGRSGYSYSDMGLDDYRALHYYGLDGLDNIDF